MRNPRFEYEVKRTTLVTCCDRFLSHLNMFKNCPNALLQVGFVQSLICFDLTLKFVTLAKQEKDQA